MPTISINTPDGKTLQLNAPDGASPDQIHQAAMQAVDHYKQSMPAQASPESGLDKAVRYSKAVTDTVGKPFSFMEKNVPDWYKNTPQGMLQQVPGVAAQIAGKAGEWAATNAARTGMNPYMAAAGGTLTAMAPDIAMAGLTPPEDGPPRATEAAVPMAEHALGFSKKFNNSPTARLANSEAGRVALENGVIPMSGSATKMMENAQALQRKAEAAMNDVFKNAIDIKEVAPLKRGATAMTEDLSGGVAGANQLPLKTPEVAGAAPQSPKFSAPTAPTFEQTAKFVDPNKMVQALEDLRNGKTRGLYKADNDLIDTFVETVKDHGDQPITLQEANAIKSKIQSSVNYGSPGDKLAKSGAAAVRQVVDSSLDEVANKLGDSTLVAKFKAAKRVWGASQRMQEGLNNRLSTKGNNIINPMSVLGGLGMMAGKLAEGSAPIETGLYTAAAMGAGMLAKKMGPSVSANLINQVGNAGRFAGPIANTSAALDRLAQSRKRNR